MKQNSEVRTGGAEQQSQNRRSGTAESEPAERSSRVRTGGAEQQSQNWRSGTVEAELTKQNSRVRKDETNCGDRSRKQKRDRKD